MLTNPALRDPSATMSQKLAQTKSPSDKRSPPVLVEAWGDGAMTWTASTAMRKTLLDRFGCRSHFSPN